MPFGKAIILADGQTVTAGATDMADVPPGRYMLRLHLDEAEVFAITVV